MKIIAITSPMVTNEDVYLIKSLLERGIDIIHLRKPDSSINECRDILKELTTEEKAKIVIHDYPELYYEFSLKGIHINRNITSLPIDYNGHRTRSCHSFEEIIRFKSEYDYLFLSPIFDSISKVEYMSSFKHEELLEASRNGLIDEKVIALGGVTFDKIPYLKSLNFGGVALSGAIYNKNAIKQLKYLSK
ncbi:MAG: thiamine phosphate synthase [Muribaculaceae bacterium]|nr:thiamine phosphate synthase [Muribaculaceae bacterium]